MAGIFSFRCSSCGAIHEGAPSFAFNSPLGYDNLSANEKEAAQLSSDFCIVGDNRYIRVCLEIPIVGIEAPFIWGVWVSLSEKNFQRYAETFEAPVESDEYFGWFCNRLPFYPDTKHLGSLVHPRSNNLRPYLELEPTDHQLSIDFHNGLTVQRAQEIAEVAMHNNG